MKLLPLFFMITMIVGCFPIPSMYDTAHVLPKGEWDIRAGTSIQSNHIHKTDEDDFTREVIPWFFPEIGFHIGVGHDFEVGVRSVLNARILELGFKYRFIGETNESLHMAIQPTAGVSFAVDSYHVGLPILLSYDMTRWLTASLSVFGLFRSYGESKYEFNNAAGKELWGGGSVNLRFNLGTWFYFSPAFSIQRTVWNHDGYPTITSMMGGMAFGFESGRNVE